MNPYTDKDFAELKALPFTKGRWTPMITRRSFLRGLAGIIAVSA
jgi:hypothetical protein